MTLLVSILVGLALASATGFRIFIPMLSLSIASHAGWMEFGDNVSWLESDTALIILICGTVIEIASYLIPVLDNVLDIIDLPIAVIAGILIMLSVVQIDTPMVKWVISIIIGGAIPAFFKAIKTSVRGGITVATGGMGNIFFSIFEAIASIFIAIVSIGFIA